VSDHDEPHPASDPQPSLPNGEAAWSSEPPVPSVPPPVPTSESAQLEASASTQPTPPVGRTKRVRQVMRRRRGLIAGVSGLLVGGAAGAVIASSVNVDSHRDHEFRGIGGPVQGAPADGHGDAGIGRGPGEH